jgi:hypothetical protein
MAEKSSVVFPWRAILAAVIAAIMEWLGGFASVKKAQGK